MIRTILFDMGGTLDGELHWLERFLLLYRSFGIDLPRETIRAAFDEAERRSGTDETIASAGLEEMIRLHVKWQLRHLGSMSQNAGGTAAAVPAGLEDHLISGFVVPVREAALENARMLASLARSGFKLGIVSNGCGNVAKLCHDFGYTPFLSVIIDSRCAGLFKPDPAIYLHAAKEIGLGPEAIMMVGDSFERDIRPAKQIGMKTAWLEGATPRDCPDPAIVDVRLRRLADLPDIVSSPALASA
jgi:putative hydrolase of the HAD superfamily